MVRAASAFAILLGLACQPVTRAQETEFVVSPLPEFEGLEDAHLAAYLSAASLTPNTVVVAPKPKPIAPRSVHRIYALDRTALAVGLVLSASELFDGVTTRYFVHHCSSCTERDPASRFLLGSRPSWAGMIAAGSIEATAATYMYENMRRSPHRIARLGAPFVPMMLIGVHIIEGSRNIPLKNKYYCLDPDYVVVGDTCVLAPPPTVTGPSTYPPRRVTNPVPLGSPHLR